MAKRTTAAKKAGKKASTKVAGRRTRRAAAPAKRTVKKAARAAAPKRTKTRSRPAAATKRAPKKSVSETPSKTRARQAATNASRRGATKSPAKAGKKTLKKAAKTAKTARAQTARPVATPPAAARTTKRAAQPAAKRPPKTAATSAVKTAAKPAPPTSATKASRPKRTGSAPIRGAIPSSLDLPNRPSAARSGRAELLDQLSKHREGGPALTAGDVDANWEVAYSSGDEAPGGDNPTPDQDVVDEIGHALGIEYEPNEELKGAVKVEERDRHRWELDPASAEDYPDHEE